MRTVGQPNITLQVLPLAAGTPRGDGAFAMLSFHEPGNQDPVHQANGAGGLFLEKEDELKRYASIFERLRHCALAPSESIELISAVAQSPDRESFSKEP